MPWTAGLLRRSARRRFAGFRRSTASSANGSSISGLFGAVIARGHPASGGFAAVIAWRSPERWPWPVSSRSAPWFSWAHRARRPRHRPGNAAGRCALRWLGSRGLRCDRPGAGLVLAGDGARGGDAGIRPGGSWPRPPPSACSAPAISLALAAAAAAAWLLARGRRQRVRAARSPGTAATPPRRRGCSTRPARSRASSPIGLAGFCARSAAAIRPPGPFPAHAD